MSKRQTHEQQTGWRYFGSFAAALCKGPVDVLHSIQVEDVPIFEGPITRGSADANGMTEIETELGTLRFYWGTETQAIDQRIRERASPVSAYRGVCYYVADHILWGDDRANPPHLTFDVERAVDVFPLSARDSEGDVSPVEALYTFLTDAAEGLGLGESEIDLPSWENAAVTIAAEGVWCSVEIDDRHSGRDIIARHLELIRGRLIESGDQIGIQLDRPTGSYLPIGVEDLLEEPDMETHDTADLSSEIYIRYRNRNRRDEETTEGYVDEVTRRSLGRARRLEIDMHWVRQQEVARRLVAREGYLATAYQLRGALTLRPTIHVVAGDRLLLHYPKAGIEGLAMVAVDVSRRPDATVIHVEEDIAIDPLTLAIPDAPDLEQDEEPADYGEFYFRCHLIPRPFDRGHSTYFFAASQPHWRVQTAQIKVEAGKDSNKLVERTHNHAYFPAACQLLWLMPADPQYFETYEDTTEHSWWIVRLKAKKPTDTTQLLRLFGGDEADLADGPPVYGIAQEARGNILGYLHVLEIEPDGYRRMVSAGEWDVLARSVWRDSAGSGIRPPVMPPLSERTAVVPSGIGLSDLLMVGQTEAFGKYSTRRYGWENQSRFFATRIRYLSGGNEESGWFETYKDVYGTERRYGFDSVERDPSPRWGKPGDFLSALYNEQAGKAVKADPVADMSHLTDADEALGRIVADTAGEEDGFWAGLDDALGKYYETGYYG